MTFDELWRQNFRSKNPVNSSTDSHPEVSSFRDPAFGESGLEDPNETKMNRFFEWLEGTLLIDDIGEGGA